MKIVGQKGTKELNQRMAITRYLSKRFDLVSQDDFEQAESDQLVEQLNQVLVMIRDGQDASGVLNKYLVGIEATLHKN